MKKVLGLCLGFIMTFVCMGCAIGNQKYQESPTSEVRDTIVRNNQLQQKYKDSDVFSTVKIDKSNTINVKDEVIDLLSETQKSFSVENKKYIRKGNNGDMDVNYPLFIGQRENIKALNKLVKDVLDDEKILGFDLGEDVVDSKLKYDIKMESDDFVSILFTGWVYVRYGNHPNNLSFTINYDLKNNKQIYLCEIVTIDEAFLEKERGAVKDQLEIEISEGFGKKTVGDVYKQLKEESQGFYFENGKIYIRISIPVGAGYMDYVSFIKERMEG